MTAEGPVVNVSATVGYVRASRVRLGVPLPRGWSSDETPLLAIDLDTGETVSMQRRVLGRWPDRSLRWILVDLIVEGSRSARRIRIERDEGNGGVDRGKVRSTLRVTEDASRIEVDTGAMRLVVQRALSSALRVDIAAASADASVCSLALRLNDRRHRLVPTRVDAVELQHVGPVSCEVVVRGGFERSCPLEFVVRVKLVMHSPVAVVTTRIRNPRAALHAGGLWDLGDSGSWSIGDLSVEAAPGFDVMRLTRILSDNGLPRTIPARPWAIYQDSSGGEHWNSPNHVEADGRLGVSFSGFAVRGEDVPETIRPSRAQPVLAVENERERVALSVRDFWQNFPMALRWNASVLSAALFPRERGRAVEIQGGEQKRHELAIGVGFQAVAAVREALDPPHAWVDPDWVAHSACVPGFVSDLSDSHCWTCHVHTIVDGPDAFPSRREQVDEYGWRHFGELWADHEAVNHTGQVPFISHYNNQYDFVLAASIHALWTGDARWTRLARECADHVVDIDVYHTNEDRAAFNGGLFWHTDHYVPARTSTHRTYSRANAGKGGYGGGPSNEHNYATGLLLHYWRTGDPDALEAVIGLADWVLAMDDGTRTVLGILDPSATGLASQTVESGYHGPGRGAGNSIAALVDGYLATRGRAYLEHAEALIRRCVHPRDDIDRHRLEDVEHRWSYLVFFQALGRYLEAKRELGERDFAFHYARESLLRYAEWIYKNEVPYADVLHKVELPTETWPAHDLRKCHVLHLAARFSEGEICAAYRTRAAFFRERCFRDLEAFPTRHLTRPLVLLAVFGHMQEHFESIDPIPADERAFWRHDHDFGMPVVFSPQRTRFRTTVRDRMRVAVTELRRMVRDRVRVRRGDRRAFAGDEQ